MSGFQGLFRIPANTLCPAAPSDNTVIPLYHAQVKSVLKSVSLIPGGALAASATDNVTLTIKDGATVLATLESEVAAWVANTPQTFPLAADRVLDAGDVLTVTVDVTGTPTIPTYMIQAGLCF
jgi:hypothetical protein